MCELTEYLVDAFYRAGMKVSMKLDLETIYIYLYIALDIYKNTNNSKNKMDFMLLLQNYHIKSFIMAKNFDSPC